MNTNPIYRQTFLNHFKLAGFLFMGMFSLIALTIILHTQANAFENNYGENSFPLVIIILCILFLPSVYLHCEYILVNWKLTVQLTDSDLIIKKKGSVQRVPLSSIKEVILFKARNYDSGLKTLHFVRYYYGRVILHNNESIVLTRLLGSTIDRELFYSLNVPVDHRPSFFNSTLLNWKD
ncbi:hypothetical protein [Ferruginibacter sp. HRS2-29]|uniref:hypothetical protein n=1 Tax=Ferruginibacter sp. HRS2-29 TaxID=2487334 RepID=UPI0020CECF9D|nr:hypothetical protein [Ferruginibacter sp. HRS2-29]